SNGGGGNWYFRPFSTYSFMLPSISNIFCIINHSLSKIIFLPSCPPPTMPIFLLLIDFIIFSMPLVYIEYVFFSA
ncbi:MAG: hypothetical protein LRZ93_04730, partial [Clostridiales bacterium]|nr:hypothetical protein [Clostridiales bacterium]